MWQLEEHFNCIQIGEKNMEKNYEQPIIMVKDIYVEDVILSSTGNVSVVDGEATWDGDIFGK